MEKIKRFCVIPVLLIMLFGYVFVQTAGSESLDPELKTIKTVSADFVQEKHLKILSKPMISKGRLYFQAPGSLRWEYFTPVRSILLVDQGQTKRYVVRDQKIIEDSSAKMQSMQIIMDEITMWLSGRYDENPDFIFEKKDKKTIILKPVKEAFSKIINCIEIHLSTRPGVINSVRIHESEDSFTKLDFKKVILNEKLDDSLFKEI